MCGVQCTLWMKGIALYRLYRFLQQLVARNVVLVLFQQNSHPIYGNEHSFSLWRWPFSIADKNVRKYQSRHETCYTRQQQYSQVMRHKKWKSIAFKVSTIAHIGSAYSMYLKAVRKSLFHYILIERWPNLMWNKTYFPAWFGRYRQAQVGYLSSNEV